MDCFVATLLAMTGESVPDFSVMPGLVRGIHVLLPYRVNAVDGRDKPGHDRPYDDQ